MKRKLKPAEVMLIHCLLENGHSQQETAAAFGVSRAAVYQIRRGTTYCSVTARIETRDDLEIAMSMAEN